MPTQTLNLDTRINAVRAVLTTASHQKAVDKELRAANGDWSTALGQLKTQLPKTALQKVQLAHSVADWSGDNIPVVTALVGQSGVKSLRDVALNYDHTKLAALVDPKQIPDTIAGQTDGEKTQNFAVALQRKLFVAEPTAVLQRMVQNAEVPIADTALQTGVVRFLKNLPDFNLRTTSVYDALKDADALKGIPEAHQAGVIEQVKTLQRVQAISPVPEAVPTLMKANLTSAFAVTEMPESAFLSANSPTLGKETAQQVYTNAINARIRNEHVLMTMREAVRGTGLAAIDGSETMDDRKAKLSNIENAPPVDIEALFGSMDSCACDDCTSVYSPASYFVELLQYLRNNDLDPNNPNSGQKGIANTPLEKLFRRRPDLGCLELTCENTDTVLPYVDLVNEVMESFVVHLDQYGQDTHDPKQATLEVFNVEDETTSELLAQPQHVNYDAYCILKSAVYPFTLPYHQPIDVIRIFLQYLGTSRYELLDIYRSAFEPSAPPDGRPPFKADELKELASLHEAALNRAVDAEFLGLTQEEYIILSKEAFWTKRYFDIIQNQTYTDDEYCQNIGVKPVYEYYGYAADADMLNADETDKIGLTFVKKQLLPRTGLQYIDLVELLKTQFINPNFLQGNALKILESMRFSYRFLQTLVDTSSSDPKIRFANLIDFLQKALPQIPELEALLHPDPCKDPNTDAAIANEDLQHWVYCYFEAIGQLIVLDAGEGMRLPIEGQLFTDNEQLVGTLRQDGTIVDVNGSIIASVNIATQAVVSGGKSLLDSLGASMLTIRNANGDTIGYISQQGIWVYGDGEIQVRWLPATDTCDLDKVRLIHLDGTPVTSLEYDRMQRFIRLWHKLDWTIDETDKALLGLAAALNAAGSPAGGGSASDPTSFAAFQDDCVSDGEKTHGDNKGDDQDCADMTGPFPIPEEITPDFLHQLVAVKKLLDLTSLPLPKLLTFWAEISTAGDHSLYKSLFLTHNLLGIDTVFQPDENGSYLAQSAKISEHIPVLMAALHLKADDITSILSIMANPAIPDALTLSNVSAIYRYSLLAKTLHVKVADLTWVLKLFNAPFKDAVRTLDLFETWGKMEDAGFTFSQLNYIISDHDDPFRPLAPSEKLLLQLTKTLYNGLTAIDSQHPDVEKAEDATSDLVRTQTLLAFDQTVVEQLVNLLEGTTVYLTNAPVNQTITIADTDPLSRKLKYSDQKIATPPYATLQITGILSDAERTQAEALSNYPEWAKAISRLTKQAANFFNDTLFGIFPDPDAAKSILLAGDIIVPPDQQDPTLPDPNTAPRKRLCFLQSFLPFLRQRLTHQLIVDTVSAAVRLTGEVTDVLLSDVLLNDDKTQSALDVLEKIKDQPAQTGSGWTGYLIPPTDDSFIFIATIDTSPKDLLLDGQPIAFQPPAADADPSNVWSTHPVKLKAGKLYPFQTADNYIKPLQWKTASAPTAAIPSSSLLPDYSKQGTESIFRKLSKAALLVSGFNLSADEVGFWQAHRADFDQFDFNQIVLQGWQRMQAYTSLRDSLPNTEENLLDLFTWAGKPDDPSQLSAHIAAATLWDESNVGKLLTAKHFDLNHPEDFRNEIALVKLEKALKVADKIGMDIDRLFDWAKPESKFWVCHQIAEDIRNALRARYNADDWEKVVKPLSDQLREDQKQALISYLLVQQPLIDWGVTDADGLFEFFLIDVQMDACMDTSRIKQAISTVQLFVQRCFLGLEEPYGVPNSALDRDRWEWMQKYRVWEANRQVFLYPENWIVPSLRDDKSPFYKELESELLQKDVNPQTIKDTLRNYLFKVDEVANLKVAGLFLEQDVDENGSFVFDTSGKPVYTKLHIFSRTRNAPYFFYYRYYQIVEKNWYPWEKVQIDIPSYDVEDANGQVIDNGTYLIPVVWNKRLLLFFPQFMKKTTTPEIIIALDIVNFHVHTRRSATYTEMSTLPPELSKSSEFWEIKMAWSEYRNGKWVQKQVSREVFSDFDVSIGNINNYDDNTEQTLLQQRRVLPSAASYQFVPRIITSPSAAVIIDGYRSAKSIAAFQFTGSQIQSISTQNLPAFTPGVTDFHYEGSQIHTSQAIDSASPSLYTTAPYFDDQKTSVTVYEENGTALEFDHPFVHELLGKLTSGNLDALFNYYLNDVANPDDAFGAHDKAIYSELKRTYSLYNWEAAFHAPMQLVDHLLNVKQFDQALKICHYVFNPQAQGTDNKRFWQFLPFKYIDAENVLETLFAGLQPNAPDTADGQITEWRNNPFQPHVVARSRPSAYMKWVVMEYIKILIAYGDDYFRQNTLETIPMAIQCYVMASHLFGPRVQKIPKRGRVQPQSYNSLLDRWDAFGNAMVEMELAFPFSNQTSSPLGLGNNMVGLANVFGFASTLYFCIPDNPQLTALRNKINDRLSNIRHCKDIQGVFHPLPLFEAPIDPGLLVQAAAQGLSLSSVLNDMNSPMPNYRFYYLLQKALELCAEVKALGNAFLSAKEKGDAETLSNLRARHDSNIQNLIMAIKTQQQDEAQKSLDALQQSRKVPVYRLQYYLALIGEDLSKVPDDSTDFSEVPNQIETPVDESGLKLIQYEKEEMDKANEANQWQIGIGATETLASILHIIPILSADVKPFGMGAGAQIGGTMLGNAAQAVARGLQIQAGNLSFQSTSAGRKGGFLRQLQDRVQQANVAGYEIKNIDKQILTQQIRLAITNQEITNQQQQIDDAQEVEDFLHDKYTNEELYTWMNGQIQTLYYQAYTLAYDLAKKAEKAYRFERGLTNSNFIQFGYWNAAYDGLLSGEQLYLALKQLEAAYQEKRGYDYEILKHVSLRQINPRALIQLKVTGSCQFSLPEVFFDTDYPGHYMRRIKSVAMTVPCIVGPYTSLNCTLRLTEHRYRMSAVATAKDYAERTDGTEDRFNTTNIPINSIAASSGQNDSGMFELNFHDERYIPFEGAGAISTWRVEFPEGFRQFDYDSISDLILHIRYTAVDGGDKLKIAAATSVQDYIQAVQEASQDGLFTFFDLKQDFSSEWFKVMQPSSSTAGKRVLTLHNLPDHLPIFTKGTQADKIQCTDVYLFTTADLATTDIVLAQDGNDLSPFMDDGNLTNKAVTMKQFSIKGLDNIPMTDWQLTIKDTSTKIEKLLLVIKYVLGKVS